MKNGRGNKLILTEDQIIAYQKGMTASALAKEIGCCVSTVTRHLRERGVLVRTVQRTLQKSPENRVARWELVIELREKLILTFNQIAGVLGTSTSSARDIYLTAKRRNIA